MNHDGKTAETAMALRAIIADVLGISPDKVRSDAALVADLNATSLDFLEMVVEVEETFHIDIHDRDAATLVLVSDIEALIARRVAEESAKTRMTVSPQPAVHDP